MTEGSAFTASDDAAQESSKLNFRHKAAILTGTSAAFNEINDMRSNYLSVVITWILNGPMNFASTGSNII